jgi:eukaryotic-like serine/threonine-protein kinase
LDRTLAEDPNNRTSILEVRSLLEKYLLRNKHRALFVYGGQAYTLEKTNRLVRLDVKNYGSLHIKYDGLNFLIDFVSGAVFINNQIASKGQILPKNCVITLGEPSRKAERLFITFDISNPEVVL